MSIPNQVEMGKMSESRREFTYVDTIMRSYHFKTIRETKQILVYEDGIYKTGGDITIEEECEMIMPDCSTYKCNEVKNAIRRQTFIQNDEEFDNYNGLINLRNGILILETGQLIPHSPDFLFRIQLPITYDQSSTCEQFEKYLT